MNTAMIMNNQMDDDMGENININLIEEFMNISEDENKIINLLKEEFNDFKFFNYGALVYLQDADEDLNNFPHISELLENYEKIFSATCYRGYLVLRQTKYYITYNDGLVIISDNGFENLLNIFKIKNIIVMYNIRKEENKMGKINMRILKILKILNLI
jgi:hypothetical protein